MSSTEELLRKSEEAEALAENERQKRLQAEAKIQEAQAQAQEARAQAQEARAQAQEARAQLAPTCFLDYIRGVEQHLYMTLTIGTDTNEQSKPGATTSVDGRFYPQHFQPWTDFKALHEATFATLAAAFGGAPLFRSMAVLEDSARELSFEPYADTDVFPFIYASIEKPAASVINRYLAHIKDKTVRCVFFRDNAYGVQIEGEESDEAPSRSRKFTYPTKTRLPDRWLFVDHQDGEYVRALVGECKAAHGLPHQKLAKVMSAPPGDDFFVRFTKQVAQDLANDAATATTTDANTDNDGASDVVFVAEALCQAYDYMLSTGVEFGYVASGDGLIFLRVPEDDPNTLYYFWSVFPVDPTAGQAGQTTRAPHETAMAYMTTLCLKAIRTPIRPCGWVLARDQDVKRWPGAKRATTRLPDTAISLRPHDRDTGSDGGAGPGPGPSSRLATLRSAGSRSRSRKRTRDDADMPGGGSSSGQQTSPQLPPMGPFVFEPPTLPYCTQACLRGLCRRLPLDDRCPNVALHRAAARNEHGAAYRGKRHPLTVEAVRSRIVAQLAANMDKDCQCLDGYGCWGRHGVLFKLTVTGFGYTFVAKAVQAAHRHILENEQAIYGAFAAFQGVLMPVCLGLVDLVWAIPLQSLARVPHMLLLSYVGPNLKTRKQLPDNVNLEAEAERTVGTLADMGLRDDDIREENLVWNAEVGRVMQIDFGFAFIRGGKAVLPAGVVVHEDVEEPAAAEPAAAEPAAAAEPDVALRPHPPLADKRDVNARKNEQPRRGSGKPRAKKRARVAGVGKTKRTTA